MTDFAKKTPPMKEKNFHFQEASLVLILFAKGIGWTFLSLPWNKGTLR